MRRLALLLLLLLCPTLAHAAVVHVQHTGTDIGDSVNDLSVAFGSNVTAGNLIVVTATKFEGGNTFTSAFVTLSAGTATVGTVTMDCNHVSGSLQVAVWSMPVTGTGSATINLDQPSGSSSKILGIAEFSGTDVSGTRVNDCEVGAGTSTTPATASATGPALWVGALATDTSGAVTHTVGSGYSEIHEEEAGNLQMTGSHEYQISTGSDTADWTLGTSSAWAATVAVYKEAGGGGATCNNPILLLGAGCK